MPEFDLEIVTPSGSCYKNKVESIILPTPNGLIEVFQGHTSLISKLDIGVLTIGKDNKQEKFVCLGGIARIDNNSVNLIIHGFESKENIDLERAKSAKERAEKRLNNKNDPNLDVKRAELALKRAMTRINLFEN